MKHLLGGKKDLRARERKEEEDRREGMSGEESKKGQCRGKVENEKGAGVRAWICSSDQSGRDDDDDERQNERDTLLGKRGVPEKGR